MKTNLLRLLSGALVAAALVTSGHGYTYILNSNTNLPVKWPDGTVNLRVMLGTTPTLIDGTNYSTSADGAAKTWNALLGSIVFQSTITTGTPTDGRPVGGSRANELAFASTIYGKDFGEKTLAVTTSWREGNTRIEGDILFNSARTWDSYSGNLRGSGPTGTYDIHRVSLHEMGHLLGLDHPDDAAQSVSAIMNSTIGNLDTLTMDDITGAQNLYGPPGVPANDNFANAIALTLDASLSLTVTGYNTNATKETGEPSHADYPGGHSVWWKWLAPSTGSVTINTVNSYFDTLLGVYTGTAVSALTAIASNDDINSGIVQASSVTFTANAGTTYYFAVDGFAGDSAAITLRIDQSSTAPTITSQPTSQTVVEGSTVSLKVTATGSGTLKYRWAYILDPFGPPPTPTSIPDPQAINGSSYSDTLILRDVTRSDEGNYSVTVSNNFGSITSNTVKLTVVPKGAPVIVTQPTNQTVTAGQTATFTVVATSESPLTYQWMINNAPATGATSATFSTTFLSAALSPITITVAVTNSVGTITSNPATVTVIAAPVVTPPPPSTPSGGGGGGGGGAPSVWFCAALSLLAAGRKLLRRSEAKA